MVSTLGQLANIRTGVVTGRKKADNSTPYAYNLLTLKCFGEDGTLLHDETDDFVAKEPLSDEYFTREGDVIVRLRAPIRAVYVGPTQEGLLVSSLFALIRVTTDRLLPRYLCDYINSATAQRMLAENIKGTAITTIKNKDLERLAVVLPPLDEQRKLVRFTTAARHEAQLLRQRLQAGRQLAHGVFETVLQRYKEENR
jgi:restriction endonuclease S subunit